jgi:hypothetical protein
MTWTFFFLVLLSEAPGLSAAKSIWSETPGTWDNGGFIMTSYLLGNGRLGGVNNALHSLVLTIANTET